MQDGAKRLLILPIVMLFSLCVGVRGQTLINPSLSEITLKAAEQRLRYVSEFKNLMAQESKIIEIFDKKNEVKKKRSIVSTFIVYQLARDDRSIAEYRNVLSVDGKKIEGADKRAEDFFERISRLDSSDKELEKLADEGSRFDQDISLNGFTLYQAAPLADNIRPAMLFRLETANSASGAAMFVVSYVQTKQSPYILIGGQKTVGDGKLTLRYDTGLDDESAAIRISGDFWIDAATFQVRREKRSLSVLVEGSNSPVLLAETVFDYQDSDFGILIPKRIEHTTFEIRRKDRTSVRDSKIIFEYSEFTRPDVEVKSSEIK